MRCDLQTRVALYTTGIIDTCMPKCTYFSLSSDNVTLQLDGILYYRVEDPYKVQETIEFLLDI